MAKVSVVFFAVAAVLGKVLMADEVQVPELNDTDLSLKDWSSVNEWTVIVQQNTSEVGEKEVPAKANITLLRTAYNISSEISIHCEVEGYPTPRVIWYKDDHRIEGSERIDLQDPHQLIIYSANTSDSGTYRCEAKNPYSNSSSSIEILVEGIHGHPDCNDHEFYANCDLIVKSRYCTHQYYSVFCCRSCTLDGQLPLHGPHLDIYKKFSHRI